MKYFTGVLLFIFLALNCAGQPCRITDSLLLDPAYPVMKEWAKAGVEGGIPSTEKMKVLRRIGPSANLQDELNKAALKGRGIVLLNKGTYIIAKPIRIPTNIVLKGVDRKQVLLSIKIHGYHFSTGRPRQAGLLIKNASGAGVENLTIKYTDAPFEPLDKDSITASWDKKVFHESERRDTTLFVEHIWIDSSKNCWVRNCDLLSAGSDPMLVTYSSHVTCTGNYVDRSYNKNDGGMGYYDISYSSYVLVMGETIRRIRHLAVQHNSKYNVLINNHLEVDINFHNGDDGYNLVEANIIRIPAWHSWHCFQRGDPGQHQPPGQMNMLFRNNAVYKNGEKESSEPDVVYMVNPVWNGQRILPTNLSLPVKRTFYAGCQTPAGIIVKP